MLKNRIKTNVIIDKIVNLFSYRGGSFYEKTEINDREEIRIICGIYKYSVVLTDH